MKKKVDYYGNIKIFYLTAVFQSFIPAYVIERLFWQERGMSIQQVVYCEVVYGIVVIIMEVPSGILADKFSRKTLLLINGLLTTLEFFILIFAWNFQSFALATGLTGIGYALMSGSQNALLYDSLLASNRQDEFEKIYGRIYALEFVSFTIAALSGGILAEWRDYEFTYIISVCCCIAALLLLFFLKEAPREWGGGQKLVSVKDYCGQAVRFFATSPVSLLYCVTGAFLGASIIYADEFWQLMLESVRVPVIYFGVIGAAFTLSRIPGNLVACQLKQRFTYQTIFSVILLLYMVSFLLLFLTRSGGFIIIIIVVLNLVSGAADPLVEGYLHHRCPGEVRATTESMASVMLRLFAVGLGLVFGYLSNRYEVFTGFAFLSIMVFIYFCIFRSKVRRQEASV